MPWPVDDGVWQTNLRPWSQRYLCSKKLRFSNLYATEIKINYNSLEIKSLKVYNTWTSQVVTHPSTTQARPCLTLEIRRDPVCSQWYGRRQKLVHFERLHRYIGLSFSSWFIDLKFI